MTARLPGGFGRTPGEVPGVSNTSVYVIDVVSYGDARQELLTGMQERDGFGPPLNHAEPTLNAR